MFPSFSTPPGSLSVNERDYDEYVVIGLFGNVGDELYALFVHTVFVNVFCIPPI